MRKNEFQSAINDVLEIIYPLNPKDPQYLTEGKRNREIFENEYGLRKPIQSRQDLAKKFNITPCRVNQIIEQGNTRLKWVRVRKRAECLKEMLNSETPLNFY